MDRIEQTQTKRSLQVGNLVWKILSSFRVFIEQSTHTFYLQTNNCPNSWASIALWRRFFENQEQEQRDIEEMLAEVVDERYNTETMRPIDSSHHAELRRQETRRAHQDAIQFSIPQQPRSEFSTQPPVIEQARSEQERIHRPNLEIPGGENPARYLPQ